MIKDILTQNKSLFGDGVHTELRAQVNRKRGVTMLSGNLTGNSRTEVSGVSARVWKDGFYGFSSEAEISDSAAKSVLRAATENAAFMA